MERSEGGVFMCLRVERGAGGEGNDAGVGAQGRVVGWLERGGVLCACEWSLDGGSEGERRTKGEEDEWLAS